MTDLSNINPVLTAIGGNGGTYMLDTTTIPIGGSNTNGGNGGEGFYYSNEIPNPINPQFNAYSDNNEGGSAINTFSWYNDEQITFTGRWKWWFSWTCAIF